MKTRHFQNWAPRYGVPTGWKNGKRWVYETELVELGWPAVRAQDDLRGIRGKRALVIATPSGLMIV